MKGAVADTPFSPDTEEQKAEFARDPAALDQYCRDVEGELNKRFTLVNHDDHDSRFIVAVTCREWIEVMLTGIMARCTLIVSIKKLHERLLPKAWPKNWEVTLA